MWSRPTLVSWMAGPYVCFTDKATNCTYTEVLNKKNDAAKALTQYLSNVKTQFGITVKTMKSDKS
jgi:hypothetical protein